MKNLTGLCFLIILSFAAVAFCSDNGILGDKVIDRIGLEIYVSIVAALGALVYRFLQFLCERSKTTWYWNEKTKKFSVNIVMYLLSLVFGKNINKSNIEYDESTKTPESNEALKAHLKKRYELLNIEIKR